MIESPASRSVIPRKEEQDMPNSRVVPLRDRRPPAPTRCGASAGAMIQRGPAGVKTCSRPGSAGSACHDCDCLKAKKR